MIPFVVLPFDILVSLALLFSALSGVLEWIWLRSSHWVGLCTFGKLVSSIAAFNSSADISSRDRFIFFQLRNCVFIESVFRRHTNTLNNQSLSLSLSLCLGKKNMRKNWTPRKMNKSQNKLLSLVAVCENARLLSFSSRPTALMVTGVRCVCVFSRLSFANNWKHLTETSLWRHQPLAQRRSSHPTVIKHFWYVLCTEEVHVLSEWLAYVNRSAVYVYALNITELVAMWMENVLSPCAQQRRTEPNGSGGGRTFETNEKESNIRLRFTSDYTNGEWDFSLWGFYWRLFILHNFPFGAQARALRWNYSIRTHERAQNAFAYVLWMNGSSAWFIRSSQR